MRTVFTTLFCFVLCATHASAQSPVPAAKDETPVAAAMVKNPVGAARGKTIDVSLGYSYVSHGESNSYRVGLNGADASFTLGTSRLGIRADLGYARAANVHGTGRHSDVLNYLAGSVFYPVRHRNLDTYIHALVGAARVSGPVPRSGGGFLLGGWAWGYAWAVGGGVDYWISRSMAIRTGADYMRTTYFDSSLAIRGENNIRTIAAVVYYFGRRSPTWR
jgi:opacity protein-like surface antigen